MTDTEDTDGEDIDPEDTDAEAEYERWVTEIREMREDKNEFFTEHPQSPIQPEVRDEFEGLSYFEPETGVPCADTGPGLRQSRSDRT
jgi:hypothetical protein